MPQHPRSSPRSSLVQAGAIWAAGLGLSIGLGTLTDLFLSPDALKAAVALQRGALNAVSSFTPERLLEQVSLAAAQIENGDDPLPKRLVLFIGDLYDRVQLLGLVPGNIFTAAVSLSGIIMLFMAILCACMLFTSKSTEVLGILIGGPLITAICGAIFFAVVVTIVAVLLGVLKVIALAALYAFGWLTKLAGLFAMAGTVSSAGYFVAMKASEKRIGEVVETITRRLLSRS